MTTTDSPLLSVVLSALGATTPKRYLTGTHRTRIPAETLATIQPHLDRFGITRVADITGLDRIGIPVYMAIRPNSRALAASQGKGLDRTAARVSAIMEAIELHQAERTVGPVRLQSYHDLRGDAPTVDPWSLPLIRDTMFTPRAPVPWVEGLELMSGERIWIPFELVHANATVPPMPGSGCFDRGTNGLASGNTIGESVLHGLCEVIERDALALWDSTTEEARAERRLDLDAVADSSIAVLCSRFEDAGVRAVCWDVTSDIELPVYQVLIFEEESDPLLNPRGAAFGSGCHPDPIVALTRALTEAAQSRLTAIAGSRDDLRPADYGAEQAIWASELLKRLNDQGDTAGVLRSKRSLATESCEHDVAVIAEMLCRRGIDQIAYVDLSPHDVGIHVVRVIVPGLEGTTQSAMYRPGARAMAHVRATRVAP